MLLSDLTPRETRPSVLLLQLECSCRQEQKYQLENSLQWIALLSLSRLNSPVELLSWALYEIMSLFYRYICVKYVAHSQVYYNLRDDVKRENNLLLGPMFTLMWHTTTYTNIWMFCMHIQEVMRILSFVLCSCITAGQTSDERWHQCVFVSSW